MPRYENKSLDGCLEYFFGEYQPVPHNSLMDAICAKRMCEYFAVEENFLSFSDYLNDNNEFLHEWDWYVNSFVFLTDIDTPI